MTALAGTLSSSGWTTWDDVRATLGEDPCLWVDLAGPHHEPAPTPCPVATHLWSWNDTRWTRIRVDGQRALATVFTPDGAVDGAGQAVTATLSSGIPWGPDKRAAPWEKPVTLLVTDGAASITFTRIAP